MKRVNAYKKLFNVDQDTDLKKLKSTYRNLVKEWHPDKFHSDDEKFAEAEVKMLLIEPSGVLNTGDNPINDHTATNDVWI